MKLARPLLALALAVACSPRLTAQAVVGQAAPAFSVADTQGQTQALDQYKGKWVVLECTNHECPFVKKHYGAGNMQKLQKDYAGKGVAWLTVISSAAGKQGHLTPAQADQLTKERGAAPRAVLLDPAGTMGRAYGAKTTPHMYVVNPEGTLIYQGAIDDKPSTDQDDIPGAKNYVRAALAEAMAGQAVSQGQTKPYGCGVKYAK